MSTVTCCKQFTQIVQALAPGPDSYWKFDALTGVSPKVTPDAIDGRNMSRTAASAPPLVAGGLFSNCLSFDNKAIDASATYFRFNSGFTLRFWMKYGGEVFMSFGGMFTGFVRSSSSAAASIRFYMRQLDFDPGPGNYAVWLDAALGLYTIRPAQVLDFNNWHQVVIRWNQSAATLSLSIDGAVVDTIPVVLSSMASGGGMTFQTFAGLSSPILIDEVATWDAGVLGRVLTDAEITEDYNGGVGRTWPW